MVEKLDMATPDLVNQNVEKIAALFPNCITETAEGKAIDFDLLKQELNHDIVEGTKERYRLEWPGKKEAIVTANLPTSKTLRPVREDSVDFDTTENLYIEGDNLEVLKLLQESYLGEIKMIYIDPPYNTGKDFVYKDNFTQDSTEFKEESGQIDEEGNRLVVNPETNGRYHSDWLTMMYPRLKLARNLLKDEGVIFISIDDNEVHNLRKVCDEVFGGENFLGNVCVINNFKGRSDDKYIARASEHLLIFKKDDFQTNGVPIPEEYLKEYNLSDDNGKYRLLGLRKRGSNSKREDRPNMFYPFYYHKESNSISLEKTHKDCTEIYPKLSDNSDGCWRWGKPTAMERLNELDIKFISSRSEYDVYQKDYLDKNGKTRRVTPKSFWMGSEFSSDSGTRTYKSIMDKVAFTNPKSIDFIKYCLEQGSTNDDIVLDFFSGSASSAHAVMLLNAEDGGKRKHIMVQLPEKTEEKSEAFKAGYNNICEIGKERIRRAAKKIKEETKADIDYGFRVYRLDDSNMQDVYYRPQDYKQDTLEMFADNVKPDRTADDLLAQVMLDWGLSLSLKIEQETISGKQLFKVAGNSLFACFESGIDEAFAKEVAKQQPLRIVFKDNSFKDDTAKENVKQLLKQLSPETEMKVI